ncbi:hypothetical protein [Neisseria sp. Ec49-e6-T10]|uniref:hypothetical protein n=1 Tax=Neisseria sp. Ec49-e6-T10 TaxID=3140744 RepID=UPI003EBFA3E9
MKKFVFTGIFLAFSTSAVVAAPIYRCMTSTEVTFTNKPTSGCQKVDLGPISVIGTKKFNNSNTATRTAKKRNTTTPKTAKNTAYPTESAAENSSRNQGRRQILEAELANERNALSKAQQALSAQNGSKTPDQVKQLQNAVTDRQKNVEAIQKELSRVL